MKQQGGLRSLEQHYIDVMKALGDSMRLRMVKLISTADEYPCTALEHELPVSKSTISYHVKLLREAELISVRRNGKYFLYSVNFNTFSYFVPRLLETLVIESSETALGT